MKLRCLLPLLLVPVLSMAQSSTVPETPQATKKASVKKEVLSKTFRKNVTIATLSVGFIDDYRKNYSVPAGYVLNNTSGIAPVYGRLEYGITDNVSVGAVFFHDVFYSNFFKIYTANGVEHKRYNTDRVRLISGGLAAYYHFSKLIPVKKLDAFAGVGLSLNNIRHSAMPQGDSTLTTVSHSVSPMLKIGARYYLSNRGSIFADLGYDRKSIFSLGFSCRFIKQ